MAMRSKRKQTRGRLSTQDALAIVRAWHRGEATQPELAERYGVTNGHVCRLCHGGTRPDIYRAIELELGDESQRVDATGAP